MTKLNPYLHFNGNCREALTFYKECLGGELTFQTVAESPMAAQMPAAAGNQILHAMLAKGELVIMASDNMGKDKVANGTMVEILIECDSDEEVHFAFGKLSEGGTVSNPLAKQFWGATFGALTDKFGIGWLLNYTDKPQGQKTL